MKALSRKQIKAKRRNALKSNSPRTPAVARRGDPSGFEAFLAGYFEKYSPTNREESDLVFQMASAQWCLRLTARLKALILARSAPSPAQNENYGTNPFSGPGPVPQRPETNALAVPPTGQRSSEANPVHLPAAAPDPPPQPPSKP